MKSKFFTLILVSLAFISQELYAQPTEWTTSQPAGNTLEFYQEETIVNEGDYSARVDLIEGVPYIYSAEFDVTEGEPYTFSIDILDNVPAYFKIYCEFLDASDNDIYGEAPVSTTDDENWQTITWSANVPTDAVKAYVWIKVYSETGFTSPESLYLDNAFFTMDGGDNLVPNGGFEEWVSVAFQSFSFQELDPVVNGLIDNDNLTVDLTVPYDTDVTALVPTFDVTEGATVELDSSGTFIEIESGGKEVDFTDPRTFRLSKDATNADYTVTVSEEDPSDAKQILSFVFAELTPEVYGEIDQSNFTIDLAVPTGTDVTDLVPTISVSEFATVSPESGVAQDFTDPVIYTVTAQDGTTRDYTVTVEATDEVVLFQEFFEDVPRLIPEDFYLINNDGYTPALESDQRWADSAWVIGSSSRPEWAGNHMAMACSYYADMPAEGRADDWMILPSITIGANSTLSWKAMSLTSSGDYPDDYRVIIAPSSESVDPSVSYFENYGEILLTVAPESWSEAVGNPGDGISNRSINLADEGYSEKDVWIAFVLITGEGGGSYLAIDDIKVVEGAQSTGLINPAKQELNTNIFPNPTNGLFNLSVKSDINATAEIEIVDLAGRVVLTKNNEVSTGRNQIQLDASELNKGIYLISTKINEKTSVKKLIVK